MIRSRGRRHSVGRGSCVQPHMSTRDYRFARSDSSTPPSSFCLAAFRCALLPFPRSLGPAIYSYRRHIRGIISKGVSTRLGEPRNRRRWRWWMEAKAVSRVEKYFSRRLRARPLRTSPILPFVLFHPFGGRSPPMLALFLTLFHSEKLSLRSRARARVWKRDRESVSTRVASLCVCVCVNDARTMALNWRLTGEQ